MASVTAASIFASAAGLFSRLGRLEQQCQARDDQLPVAREVGEHAPSQSQTQAPLAFAIALARPEALEGIGELVSDVK
jgi:hypothetical protein